MVEESLAKNEPTKVYALYIYYDLNFRCNEKKLTLDLSYCKHDLLGIFDSEEQAQIACQVYEDSNEYRHYMETNFDNPAFIIDTLQLNHTIFPVLSRSDEKCIAVKCQHQDGFTFK